MARSILQIKMEVVSRNVQVAEIRVYIGIYFRLEAEKNQMITFSDVIAEQRMGKIESANLAVL